MSSSRTETAGAAAVALVDVTMPQMGVSVAEGTVIAWRVSVGDRIEADETICEISTDKIDTEVPAPVSGMVAEILVAVETTVEVGTVLARIAVGDRAARPEPDAPAPAPSPSHDAPESGPSQDAPESGPSHDAPESGPSQDAPESG